MLPSINHLAANHPEFALVIELYGIPNIPYRPPGFETLCKIIFEQQVSLDSAKAVFDKLKFFLGDFTPQNILNCTDDDLRACGVSRQKASYIRNVADAVLENRLDLTFEGKSADETRAELVAIKGIGNWTADVYLMFSLNAQDIIPLGDIGIIVSIRELFGVVEKSEIEKLTQTFAPHRTAASFFLWHYYLKKRNRIIHM